jgi:hypothetical protein
MENEDNLYYGCNRIEIPEGYDPYDMDLKKRLNEKADEKNRIHFIRKKPVLACGAQRADGSYCLSYAGRRTDHIGYGRCSIHGGCSTGPTTPEGKQAAAQNSRVHGLYSKVMLPKERAIYEELLEAGGEALGLKHEILMMKAKIILYLGKWADRWKDIAEKEGDGPADDKTKVWFNEGETGRARNYYHAGTIEDRTLDRALNTLRRLVDAYSKMNPEQGDDLLKSINQELRAASYGQVSVSWGGSAQAKGGVDNDDADE